MRVVLKVPDVDTRKLRVFPVDGRPEVGTYDSDYVDIFRRVDETDSERFPRSLNHEELTR